MHTFKYFFGNNIRELRKHNGLTQEKLAEKIGINLRQLARIESGESFVTAETIVYLCRALNVQPYELFNFPLEEECLKTGTDNSVHFKAIRSGNIIQLININRTKALSKQVQNCNDDNCNITDNNDNRMLRMAKNINRTIFVDEIQDGVVVATKKYEPNGTFELINKIIKNQDYEELKSKLQSIQNDVKKIEFVNLALASLSDKHALDELKLLIKGIELTL